MAAYIERRRVNDEEKNDFFKKVDSLIPKRRRKSEEVPEIDDFNPTVIDKPKRQFWLFTLFSSRKKDSYEDLDEEEKEILEEMEEEMEEVDEEIEELTERKEGLLARIFWFLRKKEIEDEEEDIDPELVSQTISKDQKNEDLINETRQVLKSLHKWLSKLPPEQIEAFKRSPDFNQYKDLLDKYGLIR